MAKSKAAKSGKKANAAGANSGDRNLSDLRAAMQRALAHADEMGEAARKGFKRAVGEVETQQKALEKTLKEYRKRGRKSLDRGAEATEMALAEVERFVGDTSKRIDQEWAALNDRAAAFRRQMVAFQADAANRLGVGYERAQAAVKEFNAFIDKSAAKLDKEISGFVDRAELQIKGLNDSIKQYSSKSAAMVKDGSGSVAALWEDLRIRQQHAQAQFSEFSKASVRTWHDIAKGFERAWADLEKSTRRATGEYAAPKGKAKGKGSKAGARKPAAKSPGRVKTAPTAGTKAGGRTRTKSAASARQPRKAPTKRGKPAGPKRKT